MFFISEEVYFFFAFFFREGGESKRVLVRGWVGGLSCNRVYKWFLDIS